MVFANFTENEDKKTSRLSQIVNLIVRDLMDEKEDGISKRCFGLLIVARI